MNYERRYNEILAAIKKLQEANPSDEGIQNWINDNAPELCESEDEKMYARVAERYTRIENYYLHALGENKADKVLKECEEEELWIKNLLEKQRNDSYLQEKIDAFTAAHKGEDPEEIIAACRGYVKQGEQKHTNKEYTFNAIPRLLEMIQPTDRAKSYCQKLIDSLEQEGYSTDAKIVRERLKLMNGEKVAMATMDGQKPAWSEEDEIGHADALWAIEQARTIAKDENDMGNLWYAEKWLKSLKDRVQPQPKQEWSERDKEEFQIAIDTLVEAGQHDSAQWLKSINPQPHWKPSKEQIIALRWVLNNIPYNKHKEEISGLLDQIKDL